MAAATGEFTAAWSEADENPYSSPDFTWLNQQTQILNGGLRDTNNSGGPAKAIYNGDINRAVDIVARAEINEGGTIWNDMRGPCLTDIATGLGYWLRLNGNGLYISKQNTSSERGTTIGSAAGLTVVSGEIMELRITPAGVLTGSYNGSALITVTDTTYLAAVSPGAQVEWQDANLGSLSSFGADGIASAELSIASVNNNNEIISNGPIIIRCTQGDTVTGVTLDGVALTILTQAPTEIFCDGVDLHTTTSPPDAVVSLVITDGATSPAQDITWRSAAGLTSVVATSISTSPPGLLGTTTQTAVVGDIYEGPTTAADGQSALTYIIGGPHRNLDPAVPNGTVTEGWFYDVSASSWEIITETTNRADGALAPSWKAVPTPPACVVGLAYSYVMTGILDGDRPMTLTLETGALPAGLSLNSTNESIEGTPTASGEFSGLTIGAENAA